MIYSQSRETLLDQCGILEDQPLSSLQPHNLQTWPPFCKGLRKPVNRYHSGIPNKMSVWVNPTLSYSWPILSFLRCHSKLKGRQTISVAGEWLILCGKQPIPAHFFFFFTQSHFFLTISLTLSLLHYQSFSSPCTHGSLKWTFGIIYGNRTSGYMCSTFQKLFSISVGQQTFFFPSKQHFTHLAFFSLYCCITFFEQLPSIGVIKIVNSGFLQVSGSQI